MTETITPGATYTVRFAFGKLSPKRFRDAVALVKGIGEYEGSSAEFDSIAKVWTVTLAPEAQRALWDLQTAQSAYGAVVENA